jgi:hypothetical protein
MTSLIEGESGIETDNGSLGVNWFALHVVVHRPLDFIGRWIFASAAMANSFIAIIHSSSISCFGCAQMKTELKDLA